jgi:hypothetical protein
VHERWAAGEPRVQRLLKDAHCVVWLPLGDAQTGAELKLGIIHQLASAMRETALRQPAGQDGTGEEGDGCGSPSAAGSTTSHLSSADSSESGSGSGSDDDSTALPAGARATARAPLRWLCHQAVRGVRPAHPKNCQLVLLFLFYVRARYQHG